MYTLIGIDLACLGEFVFKYFKNIPFCKLKNHFYDLKRCEIILLCKDVLKKSSPTIGVLTMLLNTNYIV